MSDPDGLDEIINLMKKTIGIQPGEEHRYVKVDSAGQEKEISREEFKKGMEEWGKQWGHNHE